jgi:hypothetical protein
MAKVVPEELMEWFRSSQGKSFKTELAEADTSDATMLKGLESGPFRHVRFVVAYLAARDANFLLGTDIPSAPPMAICPG